MFDSQFNLSPDLLSKSITSDDPSSNNLWSQVSLDRLLEHHDLTATKPIPINDTGSNDFWSSSAQFREFFNNYNRQYQQPSQPIDISTLLSSSPPQQQQQQQQAQQQQQQQQFSLPLVDNHIFEPQPDPQPLFFEPYLSDNNSLPTKRDSIYYPQRPTQQYGNRPRQSVNIPRQQQQAYHHIPPLLQIPTDEHYQQKQIDPQRFKQTQHPAYVPCLNHGINYNGVSGPPILLPPSF